MFVGGTAFAQGRSIYKGSCTQANPLGYYQPCEPGNATADRAARCAYNAAEVQCRTEANRYCMVLGYTYRYGYSKEHPGYEYCEVKATIEGFR